MSRRPSLHNPFPQAIIPDIYSDSRSHGPQGPVRHVRVPTAASPGGGAISRSEDGARCVIAGRESLRILRICEPNTPVNPDHKYTVGPGGYRIDSSRNLWSGSGLKIDSVSTDVVWAHGIFNNKIITSARNGEIIMWDLQKSGPSKYERRTRQHVRSIHSLAYSPILQYYCITGSADGDLRVWDLRDLTDSIMKIHHPASVRSVVFSPVHWQPRHAITGLDNGNIYRWDLNMGQRGQLDRIPLAHNGPILALDWMLPSINSSNSSHRSTGSSGLTQGGNWYAGVGSGLFDDLGSNPTPEGDPQGNGWLASGGLDRTVKVWDITVPSGGTHIPRKPVYTMQTSFPVRRVAWRPDYECELAVTSYLEGSASNQPNPALDLSSGGPSASPHMGSAVSPILAGTEENKALYSRMGDPVEIWDVRRGYIAKWTVKGSAVEGGITDIAFADSHTLWAEHFSGTFSQLDLRMSVKTLDAVPRASLSWDVAGSLTFVADRPKRWELPYDDINPDKRAQPKHQAKALGNKPYAPVTQVVGIMTGHELDGDTVTFVRLAQRYRCTGDDRLAICTHNAEVALEADKPDAAQTWLLLSSLLTDIVAIEIQTPTSHLSPLPLISPKLPHSASAPAAIPTIGQLMPEQPTRSFSVDNAGPHAGDDSRPLTASSSRHSTKSRTYSSSTHSIASVDKGYLSPLRTTPVSSTTPSPHRPATPLPAIPASVSNTTISRKSSGAGATSSLIQPIIRPRLGSSYRRPSFNAQSFQPGSSLVDTDLRTSHSNLKYIGEGVLEDTDSEDGGDVGEPDPDDKHSDGGNDTGAQRPREGEDKAGLSRKASHLPGSSFWRERSASVQPSPLSRVAGQQTWTEDERDEEDSPSPASTDNSEPSSDEYDDMPSYKRHSSHRSSTSRSRRSSARSTRTTERSRSSTVASLAVSTSPAVTPARAKLMKQESRSSIRTVTPTPTPTSIHMPDNAHSSGGVPRNDTVRRVSGSSKYPASIASAVLRQDTGRSASALSSNRRSGVFYDEDVYLKEREQGGSRMTQPLNNARVDQEYKASIQRTEARLRQVGWEALKETLEALAEEGDVQMCAMLSLIVPNELKIGTRRALRFVESYVELLMRMRLHCEAAYIRKHAEAEDLRNRTAVETTIHTVCRKCGKNLLGARPLGTDWDGTPNGSFAYCKSCRTPVTTCSICRLPVRALLFLCSVCMHGGHQACYQQYYLSRPLIQLSSTSSTGSNPPSQTDSPSTDAPRLRRAASKTGDGEGSDDGSNRDGEEGSLAMKFPDGAEGKPVLSGHPCAAGCGHYCWATNDPLLHESMENET